MRGASRLAGLAALLALAGCGGDESSSSPAAAAKPLGMESAGASVQFADCGDWRGGSREERMATIVQLRGHLTPQRSASAESTLPDDHAYEVFERACEPKFAESFRLYKLYVRAQGFAPLSE
ncbi:MAG TPA: hypothetical protein VF587_06860 [Solirubrobacteraceae bacterium]